MPQIMQMYHNDPKGFNFDQSRRTVNAIKLIRSLTGLGLKPAKAYVDDMLGDGNKVVDFEVDEGINLKTHADVVTLTNMGFVVTSKAPIQEYMALIKPALERAMSEHRLLVVEHLNKALMAVKNNSD